MQPAVRCCPEGLQALAQGVYLYTWHPRSTSQTRPAMRGSACPTAAGRSLPGWQTVETVSLLMDRAAKPVRLGAILLAGAR